ncbi:MAG TPA: helix-turn-helix transcriptional regulator [Pseudonocardiaceae bacterium]|nr:helix-turn-helix transcriptional regulator [Pseudonocardiaceae bacterium]
MATDTTDIGHRARLIRRRRGLSLAVAAGLAGISTSHLSRLERGQRAFERRGLLKDLAGALGCAVADLTGQPYLPPDRATADALATLPAIRCQSSEGVSVPSRTLPSAKYGAILLSTIPCRPDGRDWATMR